MNMDLTVKRFDRDGWVRDSAGGRTAPVPETVGLRGTIQPIDAERLPEHLRATGKIDLRAHFAVDPDVRQDDQIEAPDGTILVAAAPAMNEGGRSSMWTVYGARKV